MTLGTRIAELRTKHNMSQGFLADKMNVSRQSVSKWETDASVPDIDNLIFLSNLFNVTLDELVKGEKSKTAETVASTNESVAEGNIYSQSPIDDTLYVSEQEYTNEANTQGQAAMPQSSAEISQTQKMLGYIFLAVGILSAVFGFLAGLIICIPGIFLIAAGIVCLTVKKHAGLVIGWIVALPFYFGLPFISGMNLGAVFSAYLWTQLRTYWINIAFSLCLWAVLLILTYVTVRATPLRRYAALAAGWVFLFNVKGWIGFAPINSYLITAIQHPESRNVIAMTTVVIAVIINLIAALIVIKTIIAIRDAYRSKKESA